MRFFFARGCWVGALWSYGMMPEAFFSGSFFGVLWAWFGAFQTPFGMPLGRVFQPFSLAFPIQSGSFLLEVWLEPSCVPAWELSEGDRGDSF